MSATRPSRTAACLLLATVALASIAAADDLDSLLRDDDPFKSDSTVPAAGPAGPMGSPLGEDLEIPELEAGSAAVSPSSTGSCEELWGLLHVLSARVRQASSPPPAPTRRRALELALAPLVAKASGSLAGLAKSRTEALLAELASTPRRLDLEDALDGAPKTSLAALAGGAASAAASAEAIARRQEDRWEPRLDALIYGPLPADEVLRMLRSGDDSEVDRALTELRERGAAGLTEGLLSRLAELGSERLMLRVIEAVGESGGPAERSALAVLASEGAGSTAPLAAEGLDGLDGLISEPTNSSPATSGPARAAVALPAAVRDAAREAAGRIRGRMDSEELFTPLPARSAEVLAEAGARRYAAGEVRQAAECWRRAAALEPDNPLHAYNRARALYRLGLFAAAQSEAARAARTGTFDRRYLALELGCLRALARFGEARALLLSASREAEGGSSRSYVYGQLASDELAEGMAHEALRTVALARASYVGPAIEAAQASTEVLARLALGQLEGARLTLQRARQDGLSGPKLDRAARWVESAVEPREQADPLVLE